MDNHDNQPVDNTPPALSPKLLTDEKDMLVRAVEKWLKFQTSMWNHVNAKLEPGIRREGFFAIIFRLLIIILSTAITTISDINAVPRLAVTIVAGILTALTGIEAYLKMGERQAEAKKQQREIEDLRDDLRFQWFVAVEIEADMEKRLASAKKLLQEGQNQYNEILNKYTMKAEKGQTPEASK